MRTLTLSIVLAVSTGLLPAAQELRIYSIDVEGGQSTLFVSPSGESLLVDTGWDGNNSRDADRIVAAAKSAGVKQIDYLVTTHFHDDHVGGLPQLAAKIPIRNFVDHGPSVESRGKAPELYKAYTDLAAKGKRLQVKPGDKVPIKGLDVTVISAAGEGLPSPLAGAGQPNPACATAEKKNLDRSENAQSLGTLIVYGKFKLLDLGDLTWNKELDLVCPNNKIGTVTSSPGIEDLWQLHYSIEGGQEHNVNADQIANPDENCEGKGINLTARQDGTFTVVNLRNKFEKTYKK